jgi:thiol-disulfide isomerase/thioredoxin
MKMKKNIIIVFLALIFTAIGVLFWHQEFKYSLPTPVPNNYKVVNLGSNIQIPEELRSKNNKPVFLHFFNPDCPCSKFNVPHFKSLVKQYGNQATFAIVVMSDKNYSAGQIQNRFDIDIPVLFDPSLAASYGVYSTPQAVIIDINQKLYYRGNYNRTRYCTDKKSNYAQQALDSLLSHKDSVVFNQFALKAYGCQLPNCSKQ